MLAEDRLVLESATKEAVLICDQDVTVGRDDSVDYLLLRPLAFLCVFLEPGEALAICSFDDHYLINPDD